MKGAVQGAATTTASAPVKTPPIRSARPARPPPRPCSEAPISKTPERSSAAASSTRLKAAVTTAGCSCAPQPTASPAPRSAMITPARPRKAPSTPTRNARPCARAAPAACGRAISEAAFIERIGKTQGIRLRMRPPANAKRAASASPSFGASTGAPSPLEPGGGGPGLALTSNAAPSAVSTTPEIAAGGWPCLRASPAGAASVRPCGPRSIVCGLAWSISPGVSGKK